ncbi:MAG: reprolysin-like metallopeptidase [Verrucomicrobiota bacterium]
MKPFLSTTLGCCFGIAFLLVNSVSAQPIGLEKAWTHLPIVPAAKARVPRWVEPERGQLFRMDGIALRRKLAQARRDEPRRAKEIGTEIEVPMPDGTQARFSIVEAPIMEPELAAKFPSIKTYAGQGIDDPEATVRLDLSPSGFHAQVLSPRGAVYVDPAYRGDTELHVSYYKRDYRRASDEFQCFTAGRGTTSSSVPTASASLAAKTLSGTALRTFRLAVAATGEYSAFFGGTVTDGLAAIVTAINRVDGVYETELAVRLVLVANNDLLVYTDGASDPYTNDDTYALLDENQANVDAVIGTANYDIGHVFSTAGGGLAGLGVVCDSNFKAQGETGRSAPIGDPFYIDYVAHEMGHQFGADHTFNSTTGSCNGNRVGAVAFEPGSGSTIMAYAGICSPNDLQAHSDPYFHAGSLDQIQTYITSFASCAVSTGTGNNAPTVSAGANYSIPKSTPFVLTATGSDANGDPLTYCWEQMDVGVETSLTDPDNGSSPLFRSVSPANTPLRYFPKLSSVLANTNWNQEKLPSVGHTLHLRVTARDNRPGGGGVANADTQITVVSTAGPFVVNSPNTAVSWGGNQTVTWSVANTASSPINAAGVNIYLSADGGNTFPYLLATNVSNNGSRVVTLPNISTSHARIKVQAAGNIFYDVCNVDFTVVPNSAFLQLAGTTLTAESGSPTNGAIDPYETVTVNWSLKNIGLSPTTNLVATLLATNGIFYPSAPQSFGAIPVSGTVARPFSFVPSGACGGSVTGVVQLTDGPVDMGKLSQVFSLGASQSSLATQVVANANAISIRDTNTANPYPASVVVSGITGTVVKVTATLSGFEHTYPQDVGVLLVAPSGQAVNLMDGCGFNVPVSGKTFTFDDAAVNLMSDSSSLTSGTFRPSDYFSDMFDSPAPSSYGNTLSALAASPNGTWSLYAEDFNPGDSGSIAGGWSLKLVVSNTVWTCSTTFPTPTFTSTVQSNDVVQLSWNAIPGPHYQVQYRTNLAVGGWKNLGAPILATNALLNVSDAVTNGPIRFYRVIAQP